MHKQKGDIRSKITIGVDLMGAESSPSSPVASKGILEAVISCAVQNSDTLILLCFATHHAIESLSSYACPPNVLFHPCLEEVTMDDHALGAIKKKKQSSLVKGLVAVQGKTIDAFVTCANTGALVAAGLHILRMVPPFTRPSLVTLFPTKSGRAVVLDVGAVPACKAEQLVELALLGAAFCSCEQGIKIPRVALLNIGVEPEKGEPELKKAWHTLSEKGAQGLFSFVGNKEPHAVFEGEADVVVTSGFVGNIFLKTAEATAAFLPKEERSCPPCLKHAMLCGVQGIVMKCHGLARYEEVCSALDHAQKLVNTHFLDSFEKMLLKK